MLVLMLHSTDVKQMLHEFESMQKYGKRNLGSVRTRCCMGFVACKVELRTNKLNESEKA